MTPGPAWIEDMLAAGLSPRTGSRLAPMTQDDLREVYLQTVEGRLHDAACDMAWDCLKKWLDLRSGWGWLHATNVASVPYRYSGDDPVLILAYRDWMGARLARCGWETFVQANPPEDRRLMGDRLPRVGRVSETLLDRLGSPDARVRGTAMGDLARGWA